MSNIKLAIVGATGAVGREFLRILAEQEFPAENLFLVASSKSAGKSIKYFEKIIEIEDLQLFDFSKASVAFFSAGSSVAESYASKAIEKGCTVIDNSSFFRNRDDIELIVPEVNGSRLEDLSLPSIIANPNCSTAQMVVSLKPFHDLFKIKRVDVATYQSVSGTGQSATEELKEQSRKILDGEQHSNNVYPVQIAFNALPLAGDILENDYSEEEMKLTIETKKIFSSDIEVSATCVRVPVQRGHGEVIHLETEKEINLEEVKDSINNQNGLILCDSDEDYFPTPVTHAENSNEVFIGRLRKDLWKDNRANFWIVSDNLRKGAAWNSYQILSSLIKNKSHELLNDEYAEVGDPIDARLNLAVSYIEMGKAYDAKAIIYEVFDLSPNFEQKNKADTLLQRINDQGS